jgi:subtilisin-like proprotein convertase family protein
MPTPNVSFNGIGNPDGCGSCLPPDTNGEIGPTQYVQTVNTAWRVFSRSGTALTPVMSLGSLFSALPGPCANVNDGDPIVMYDQLADRWLISQFCWSVAVPNHQIIAISKTGDATGAYYLYDFVMPNIKFDDYPHFGVWPDAYYMTDNQFDQAGTAYQGVGVFAFDRSKMLGGDPTASFVYFDKAEGCSGNGANCQFGGMLPTDMDGFVSPPAGAPNPIIQFDANEFNAATPDSLRIFDFHVDFATPANSTLTERTGSPLLVAAFDPREVPINSRNVVPQPGGSAVDVISDRLMWRIAYRNFGTHESLALNHSVNAAVNPAFRAGVRYYELRKTTPGGAWAVQEQATMAGPAGDLEHRWMGSTALNLAGSQAVGYSVSSSTVSPSVRYAGRLAGDPPGSLAQGEAVMVAGSGFQTSTSGRWGDYSDLTVDPIDDCTFWFTQEYYSATSGANWNTRIGSFTFGSCPAIQKGVLNGSITSVATGNPINNATVVASNGFSRSSNASGVYSIDPMATGTVTLTVSAPGFATATVPGVVITSGNTTTQNVQLTPLNTIVAGASSVVADSCNSNLALDPNEVVTVNLALNNIGGDGASTSNLTATLQATGGVTNPSGPQNYGAVVSGQPAVSRPFTFTVSATCGGTVTATLALQDGATNYGTRTFTFPVGLLSGAFPTTGAISVIIPDSTPAGVDIPITVPDNVTINDVNVRVRINHTYDADLNISLVHPDNTTVLLSVARGESSDNFGTGSNDCAGTPTIFDDQAATAISAGTAPFAGSFRPDGSLATLNGKPANGTWKLHIEDTAFEDIGRVGCVTLEINKRFVCCGPEMVKGAPDYTLTAESITPANNAPDPNETVTVNFSLKNIGGNDTTNLVATLQPTGGVAAPSGPQTYGVVTTGGPAVSKPFTFVATGACGGTINATLALQDGAAPLPPITFTIPIGTQASATQTFSNTAPITINDNTTATPYQSNLNVSGMTGTISKVTLTLTGLNHTIPSDVDLLLVGPTGVKFTPMSDVIGGNDWVNINYTFDDAAADFLPTTLAAGVPPVSGTFKPTNVFICSDQFPPPAPAGPYLLPGAGTGTQCGVDTLAAFNGTNPNGTWSLYTLDDGFSGSGNIAGGWSLSITTQTPVCNTQTCSLSCPSNITVPADGGGTSAVVNFPLPTVTGACGVPTYVPPSGSTFQMGTTSVIAQGLNGAQCSFTVTVTGPSSSSGLIISEFRLRGTSSGTEASDEFIELYNNSGADVGIGTTDGSSGWAVAASDGVARCVVPNGTVVPNRGHYLCVNSTGYSLGSYPAGNGTTATGDATYTTGINDNVGIALFNTSNPANFTLANRLDAVGSDAEANTLYREGTGYPALAAGLNINYSLYRKFDLTTGLPTDTNNNANDFFFIDTAGTSTAAGQHLGAPGPENLSSPIQRNSTIKLSLIDPGCVTPLVNNACAKFRDNTPDIPNNSTLGTLSIRRKVTNNTGGPVTRLRFRVVDITTLPSGASADVRFRTSSNYTANLSGGGTTPVIGVTLESPPTQALSGGYNASGSVGTITLGTPLAAGNSVNIHFLLGVQQSGVFRFYINVEALP